MKNGGRPVLSGMQKGVTKIPDARPRIAENETLAPADFDTGGISPVAPPDGEGKIPVDKGLDLLIGREILRSE
jgi:hypothetical protein